MRRGRRGETVGVRGGGGGGRGERKLEEERVETRRGRGEYKIMCRVSMELQRRE